MIIATYNPDGTFTEREMTPEEIADMERMEAEMPVPEPTVEERVSRLEKSVKTERISREDFDLLDVQDEDTIYYIIEDDGTVTVRKGE